MSDPLVSTKQITSGLGMAKESVCHWIERRGLTAHRIGRFWKFEFSEIDELVRTFGAGDDDKKESIR